MSPHTCTDKDGSIQAPAAPELWITGLGSQYPPYVLAPEKLEDFARRFYDTQIPGLKKLLEVNRKTGIQTRSSIITLDHGFGTRNKPPTIVDLDSFFRKWGVDLTVKACEKALEEWAGDKDDITHTIAVTCTNQGNPGYDLLVNQKLGLGAFVDRMLLHGVGCAGALAILRAAAQIAAGAAAQGIPARILAFACELCTLNVRRELAAAEQNSAEEVGIAGALFSDGAAAFVLCNRLGMGEETKPLFQLLEWANATIPDTAEDISFYVDSYGFRTVLSRDVPSLTKHAVKSMFDTILPDYSIRLNSIPMTPSDFDWALHPGGQTIIDGVKDIMDLTEYQLRATREIYRTKGNSSSATVLIVLDKLRSMRQGSDHVVATSFGPGLTIEMAMLRYCRRPKESETHGEA